MGEEGRKRRLGFGKKGKSSFTVHRSEEVLPEQQPSQQQQQQASSDAASGRSGRQPSSASSDGEGEGSGDGDRSDFSSRAFVEAQTRDFCLFLFSFSTEREDFFAVACSRFICCRSIFSGSFIAYKSLGDFLKDVSNGLSHRQFENMD